MMHSSAAVDTPPPVSAPPAFDQFRTSPYPMEVSGTPLPFLSIHRPDSTEPICTTELPSRLEHQAAPRRSTVVREGLSGWPCGAVRYSPSTLPVRVLILTIVPLLETATQRKWVGAGT